jgi:transcriptional regulator with XRE-family HTH domain
MPIKGYREKDTPMASKKEGKPNLLLRQARDDEKLTQQDLADKLGTTALNVGRWEGGKAFPNPYFRRKLCEFFNKPDKELGLVRELYHTSDEVEETDRTRSEPNLRQEENATPTGFIRRRPLIPVILCSVICILVIGGSILVFMPKIPASKAKTNPVIGSLLYHYQLPKIGSYETLVNALAWSRNGSYLACASGDKVARVFELGTESEVTIFHGHNKNVNSIVWLPNGTQVASASSDQTVQIWDAFSGHALAIFSSAAPVWAVAVSPDGKEIAWAGKDGITELWQITPKMRLFTYTGQADSGGVWGLAFSHNGKFLAAGDNAGDIQIFDVKNGRSILNYTEQTKTIYSLSWSPDDRYIASASGDNLGSNGSVRVWNTSNRKTIYVYEHYLVAMQSVSWSPDGARIASASTTGCWATMVACVSRLRNPPGGSLELMS